MNMNIYIVCTYVGSKNKPTNVTTTIHSTIHTYVPPSLLEFIEQLL